TAGPREEILPKLLGGEYTCRCPQRNGGGCQ
ncbi:MAG TPA: ABC transporter ATP-binding protein, partial [Ruminococcaceae bacterium]|nr:ABC transporter ATP-binding protein [Oscillospiraceae bacterium]